MASTDNIKTHIDPSNFSDPSEALELYPNMIKGSIPYDAFNYKTRFNARILSRPVPMTADDIFTYQQASPERLGTPNAAEKRGYLFRARIIDDPSPHWAIPDPCDVATGDLTQEIQGLIALHTKFVMMIPDMGDIPAVGDIVAVELEKNAFSYNLQIGTAIKKVDKNSTQVSIFSNNCGQCQGGTPAIDFDPSKRNSPESPRTGEVYDPPGGATRYAGDSGVRGDGTDAANLEEAFDAEPYPVGARPEEPPAIVAMRKKGYDIMGDYLYQTLDPSLPVGKSKDLWNVASVNIIGIRRGDPQIPNQFVDRIQTIYFANGVWYVYSSHATTVAGSTYMQIASKWDAGVPGVAVLDPHQNISSHRQGSHTGYSTLSQKGNLLGHREDDRTKFYNDDTTGDPANKPHTIRNKGINIHNSGDKNTPNKLINNYSAGCQVFKYKDDWQTHKDVWYSMKERDEIYAASDPRYRKGSKKEEDARDGQEGFDRAYRYAYTLLEEKDIKGGLPAADADALVRWGWDEATAASTVAQWPPQGPLPWSEW